MKKIAILGLHLNYGGVEQTIINQANMLSENYDVELAITYKLNEKPAFKINPKVKVTYLTSIVPNREEFKRNIKNKNYVKAFKEGLKSMNILQLKKKTMKEYIINSNADIIISSRIEFTDLLSKYKSKNVITIAEEHCHHNNNKKYIKRLKKACKNIDYLVPVSQELTNFYQEQVKTAKCIYIPNCLNKWSNDMSKLNNKNLISIGRLSPEKGYLDLIDFFKEIYIKDKEYHLDIIGNGIEYDKIKNKIEDLKLNDAITLWGFKDTEFINKRLKESSLYLMCSYEESFGIVLIEAGALGVPSIVFDSAQGAHEIIEDNVNGYLIANRNKKEMANKVIEIINNHEKLEILGKNAKDKAKAYTFEKVKEKWIDFLNNIIEEKNDKLYEYFDKLYSKGSKDFYKVVEENLKKQKRMFIVTANPETFTHGKNDDDFNKLLIDKNTTLIPDGIGIVKAAKILKYNITERITGIDLANKLLQIANENSYKVSILGATESVIKKLKIVLSEKYPNISIVKIENGYTKNKDKYFEELKELDPDICLVALGIPHQEKLIHKHLNKFKKGIFVGVGGSLDVISGSKKRAPKIFQKLNLEWLYRITKEPKRLKRFYDNNIKFIIKIKRMKNNSTNSVFKYYLLLFLFYFLVAFINQYYIFNTEIKYYLEFKMLYFCFFWSSMFLTIRYLLPNKIGKISTLLFQCFLVIITIINYFYNGYFDSIFSFKDLILSGEGLTFISSIYSLIGIKIILVTLILTILIYFTVKHSPTINKKINIKAKIIIIIFISILIIGYIGVKKTLIINEKEEVFNDNNYILAINNKKTIYSEWNNSKKALEICGMYEYIIRDLYFSIFSNDNPLESKKYIDKHLNEELNQTLIKSDYYGIFENKNLILVMMESADDWQINEKSTPTIYKMKKVGIDFQNHYSPYYVTGKTAQSEFMANTGIYPKFNSVLPHYGYVQNNYKYSLPNLFKEKGYEVNSFHRTSGAVYNRENMMLSLGYKEYYNVFKIGLEEDEYDLDHLYATKGYDKLIQKGRTKPFMSFYITFSNHSPYTLNKKECKMHYDDIKELFPEEKDESKLCGYAQMRETDNFFKELINRLKEDNILDDTVIIAFSDHSNSMYLSKEETNKLNKTEMFIYNPQIKSKQITSITSTINILPMINNLFNLNSPYFQASYDPLNSNESYVVFNDYTYYNGKEVLPITTELNKKISLSKNILISDYYN